MWNYFISSIKFISGFVFESLQASKSTEMFNGNFFRRISFRLVRV